MKAPVRRVIPCLDVDHGRVVKGVNFLNIQDAGNPVELARRYCGDGADEIVFLDITASPEKRKVLKEVVKSVAMEASVPLIVGGGIRTVSDARLVVRSGADKVSIATVAVEKPSLIRKLAKTLGRQRVVVAIDAKRRYERRRDRVVVETSEGPCWFEAYTYGGRKATELDAVQLAIQEAELGAGELLVTSMDRDGTEKGYDLELTCSISERVDVPVIASGGAGNPTHFLQAFTIGKADAALAASVFHYSKYPISVVKRFLHENGVAVRL